MASGADGLGWPGAGGEAGEHLGLELWLAVAAHRDVAPHPAVVGDGERRSRRKNGLAPVSVRTERFRTKLPTPNPKRLS